MKKTFSINLNGLLFNIDEDAFEKLNTYLKTLKQHFKSTKGGEDIVNDIEARCAELLKERTKELQKIISISDVESIIETLGQPYEMDEEKESKHFQKEKKPFQKRIFRDPDNQMIAGVSSGLAAYFSIDPLIVRLLFALSILIGGAGIIVYIALWVLTPFANTTAEKLEMEGERIDIHSIEKKVKGELNLLKDKLEGFTTEAGVILEGFSSEAEVIIEKNKKNTINWINEVGEVLYNALKILFRAIGILIGIFFLLIGIAFSISIAALYIGALPHLQFDAFNVSNISFPDFLSQYIFNTSSNLILQIMLLLLVGIPVLALIFGGIRLIFNLERQKYLGLVTLILYIVLFSLTFVFSIPTIKQFQVESKKTTIIPFDSLQADTLLLEIYNAEFYKSLNENDHSSLYFASAKSELNADENFYGNPILQFSKAENELFSLEIHASAHGENSAEAKLRIDNITSHFEKNGNTLLLTPYFTLQPHDKWRAQEVVFELKIPEGKTVFIHQEVKRYFQWKYWEYDRWGMPGKYWQMTKDGLVESGSSKPTEL